MSSSSSSSRDLVGELNLNLFQDQRLRDFRLSIEYKYLQGHAPGGVFILPELDDIRTMHGVVFVRRGLYRNGVFRFTLKLPKEYNSRGTYPVIKFDPPIYNPLVNIDTGIMDITLNDRFLEDWLPDKHFLATVVTSLKKIFYMKSYDPFQIGQLGNEGARKEFDADKDIFGAKVAECVQNSLDSVYKPVVDDNCTFVFTRPTNAHELIRQAILGEKDRGNSGNSSSDKSNEDENRADIDIDIKGNGYGYGSRDRDEEVENSIAIKDMISQLRIAAMASDGGVEGEGEGNNGDKDNKDNKVANTSTTDDKQSSPSRLKYFSSASEEEEISDVARSIEDRTV